MLGDADVAVAAQRVMTEIATTRHSGERSLTGIRGLRISSFHFSPTFQWVAALKEQRRQDSRHGPDARRVSKDDEAYS